MRYTQDKKCLEEWFKHATVAAPFFNVETFFPELIDPSSSNPHPSPFHIVIGNPPYGGTKIPDEVKDALGLGSKDPYGAFIARFMGDPVRPSPLAEGGVLAYIVSDTFMTIKTHRPLREQMLRHRVHKMIRVAGDTFKATVNCAVILAQRGTAPTEHTCQMADLTNVSIHDQYERFLHLLYQTEGTGQMSRRQNVSNQTYALYHYRQSLIPTNSNLPFFVASPKLFALMNDTTAPMKHETIGGKRVPIRTITLNAVEVSTSLLGDSGRASNGLSIGSSNRGLIKRSPLGYSGGGLAYEVVDPSLTLTTAESLALSADEKENGVRSYESRVFVPYDKGADLIEEGDDVILPNYYAPIQFYVDWSPKAVRAIRTNKNARVQGAQHYFTDALTYSFLGYYSPTFRLGNGGVFDVGGSPVNSSFYRDKRTLLAVLASKFLRFVFRSFLNHSVNLQVEEVNAAPLVKLMPAEEKQLAELVAQIVAKQKRDAAYDYASNEQVEIDRLVYAAYGLNDADNREVEDWYARRYPKLAQAQRRALAAKQGKTEEQLLARPVLHLYCDESRHLPKDRETVMLMGALACPAEATAVAHRALKALCKSHGLPSHFEIKWTKVSPAKIDFYRAVLDWFLSNDVLSFRCLVLPDKARTMQRLPETSRDHIYYGLYYQLLRQQMEPENRYRAFLDMKDTRGREKLVELTKLLRTDADEFSQLQLMQHVRSHEIGLLQITDFLLGAVGYARSSMPGQASKAKLALVRQLEESLGFSLATDSPPGSSKVRIATWHDSDALLL